MYILGYNCYVFNSAAALLKDGELIAAAQEERFTRRKTTGAFPVNSIESCLSQAGISIADVDFVGFHWRPFHGFHERIWLAAKTFPDSLNYFHTHSDRWLDMVSAPSEFKRRICDPHGGEPRYEYRRVKHHLCHAGSAFFLSPFARAATLTIDGSGEIASSTMGVGEDRHIRIFKEIRYPQSLGYLYVSLTHYLGFVPDCDEYKVMALASYGEDRFRGEFERIVRLKPEGEYEFDLSYFNYHRGVRTPWVSQKFIDVFGPPRLKGEPLEQRHKDIAWALQKRVEEAGLHMARHLHAATGLDDLCLAGGVALNSVMNTRILRETPFKRVFVQPAANDAGCAIGSAYHIYHSLLGRPRGSQMEHAFLGPGYSDEDCRAALEAAGLSHRRLEEDELVRQVAELIAAGKVVDWFQGRMEMGARALGNRSILADPRRADMKDVLNSKVKLREDFRPFAPSVLAEAAPEYFDCPGDSPFMLFVFKVREEKRAVIPAVTHVDGTARIQTVRERENPRYYKLIQAFAKLTGVPVLLNTSFNVMGEPIVCSPADAVRCFQSTGIDTLALGNHLAQR